MSTIPLASTYSAGSMSSAQAASYGADDQKYVPPSVSVSTMQSAPAPDTVVVDAKLFAQLMAAQQGRSEFAPISSKQFVPLTAAQSSGGSATLSLESLTLSLDAKPKNETITFPDGSKYVGEVREGADINSKAHGKGVMTYFGSKNASYDGDFVDGKRHGRGILMLTNGDKYEGEWANNLAEGQGRFQKTDGSSEIGIWKDGSLWTGQKTYATINGRGVRDVSEPKQWKEGYLDSWSTCHNMGCPDCCGMANEQLCVII